MIKYSSEHLKHKPMSYLFIYMPPSPKAHVNQELDLSAEDPQAGTLQRLPRCLLTTELPC